MTRMGWASVAEVTKRATAAVRKPLDYVGHGRHDASSLDPSLPEAARDSSLLAYSKIITQLHTFPKVDRKS